MLPFIVIGIKYLSDNNYMSLAKTLRHQEEQK